ncbi:hypothetical protein GW915_11760 [bacterium]|nr:hypothetical protein [bacterium]
MTKSSIKNAFIVPLIEPSNIDDFLFSFMEYCGQEHAVVFVNQIPDYNLGLSVDRVVEYKANKNLGFSQAMNTGMSVAISEFENLEYVTACNDDVVFLDYSWWAAIENEFVRDDKLLGVIPTSPKEPAWGYGNNVPVWAEKDGDFIYIADTGWRSPTEVDYKYLLDNIALKRGYVSGGANWCLTFSIDRLNLFLDREGDENPHRIVYDERFYPGGGEDYDLVHRAFGKDMRIMVTPKAWVWHKWYRATDYAKNNPDIVDNSRKWNRLSDLYETSDDGWKSPIYQDKKMRTSKIYKHYNG